MRSTKEQFRVGDICELINAPNYPHLVGAELTITGALMHRPVITGKGVVDRYVEAYGTDLYEGVTNILPRHDQLRFIRGPKEWLGEQLIINMFATTVVKPAMEEDLV